MLRFAKALALVLALGACVRADVVISGGAAGATGAATDNIIDVYDGTTTANQYAGFSFNTNSTPSSAGNWALSNLKFNLFAAGTGTTLGNYTVRLFELSNVTPAGQLYSKSSTGGSILDTGTGSEFSLNLLGGSGTNSLEINKNYYMSFDFNFTGGSAVALLGLANSTPYNTATWNPTQSYEAGVDATSVGLPSSTNIAYALEAVAVPEPGTLLLGGIAAMGGAGGWWARRRKKAAAADAVAEGEQAATV